MISFKKLSYTYLFYFFLGIGLIKYYILLEKTTYHTLYMYNQLNNAITSADIFKSIK